MDKTTDIATLKSIAKIVRKDILNMVYNSQSGHIGGSMSSTEIMVALFFNIMDHDPSNPKWEGRDYFIMSKGHCSPVYYSVLARTGYFPIEELLTFRKINSRLEGHPSNDRLPCVEVCTGSLGQGLSVANGIALGLKLDNLPNKVFCMMGDGELNEGQTWEAFGTGAHKKLDNVIAIIDNNGLQIDGFNKDVKNLAPIAEKLRAFHWYVFECDGHNIEEVINVLNQAKNIKDMPVAIVAKTVKGKGVSFMENKAEWHGKAPKKEQYDAAIKEIDEKN